MAYSEARTVEEYLAELPAEQRRIVAEVRQLILKHLPVGYEEVMNWGMITYQVPLARYPQTYNGKPLMYAALAAQKHNYSLYMTGVYMQEEQKRRLQEAFARMGVKPDMGKSCIRFRQTEALPLDEIGQLIAEMPVDRFIAEYEAVREGTAGKGKA